MVATKYSVHIEAGLSIKQNKPRQRLSLQINIIDMSTTLFYGSKLDGDTLKISITNI